MAIRQVITTQYIQNIPLDLWNTIFRYLSPAQQLIASRVCRAWHAVVTSPRSGLYFEELFTVSRLCQSAPHVQKVTSERQLFFHQFSQEHLLISVFKDKTHSSLCVLKKDWNGSVALCPKDEILRLTQLVSAKFVASGFVTACKDGTVIVWDMGEKLTCRKVLKIFDQVKSKCHLETLHVGQHLTFVSGKVSKKKFIEAFSMENFERMHLSIPIKKVHFVNDKNSDRIWMDTEDRQKMVFAPIGKKIGLAELGFGTSLEINKTPKTDGWKTRMVGVNDRWIVVGCYYYKNQAVNSDWEKIEGYTAFQTADFHIFDVKTLAKVHKITEDCRNYSGDFEAVLADGDRNLAWLSGNFLITSQGKQLSITYLLSGKCIGTIPLADLLEEFKEKPALQSAHFPIFHIELAQRDLRIVFKNRAGTFLKIAKFSI